MNDAPAQSWASETFSPLSNSTFRMIWIAGSASYIGSMVQITAAAWVMTTLTQSALTISLVQTAASVPFVMFALLAGACADMYDRRIQMLVGNGLCFLTVLLLTGLTFTGQLSPALLLGLTALIGTGTMIAAPAWQASVVDMIDRENLTAAISLNNLSFNLARCIGPAIGAEIVLVAGAAVCFLANSVSYLLMIFALSKWNNNKEKALLPPENVGRAIRDGLQFARLSPALRVILTRALLIGFCASTLLSMPPLLAIELKSGARGLGVLLVCFGAGSMAGSLALAWVRARLASEQIIFVNICLVSFAMLILGLSQSLLVTGAALALAGLSWMQTMASLQVAAQTSCPRWVVGRTVSIFAMALSLGIAIGASFWGWTASVAGVSYALFGAAAAMLCIAALVRGVPFYQPSDEALQTSEFLRPETVPNIDYRVGPIVAALEYDVLPECVESFRASIEILGSRRSRDGARNWQIMQSADAMDTWIETFESPTWGDYLRRAARRLASDDDIQSDVLRCCRSKPIVRRWVKRTSSAQNLAARTMNAPREPDIPWKQFLSNAQ